MFMTRYAELNVKFVAVRNATERIPEHLRERFKFHIQQLPKVVQEILKYVSCCALQHSYGIESCLYQVLSISCCVAVCIDSVFTVLAVTHV